MKSNLSARLFRLLLVVLPVAAFADVTPYPPAPGDKASLAYKVTVNGQSVFVHNYFTYDQFNWMDYASFSMTGKVHVEIDVLISEREAHHLQYPAARLRHPADISGNKVSFDLDQPRYLVLFFNDDPAFNNTGLMLFAEPPEAEPVKLGDPTSSTSWTTRSTPRARPPIPPRSTRPSAKSPPRPAAECSSSRRGVYLSGPIVMKSNVTLYVDAGAVIRGTGKTADYALPARAKPSRRPGRLRQCR